MALDEKRTPERTVIHPAPAKINRTGNTEAVVVVPVVCGVPVAVRRAEFLWIVVPGTAAKNTTTRGHSGSGARMNARPGDGSIHLPISIKQI